MAKITGTKKNDRLFGTGAADTIYGLDGNDLLDGKGGADILIGGTGNDTYVIDNIKDKAIELAKQGTDLIQASVSFKLGLNIENLTLTGTKDINATGNGQNNILTGNAAANILKGGLGNDQMIGGAGDDTYYVDQLGDVVTELEGNGSDWIISTVSYTLGVGQEILDLMADGITGNGNSLNNTIVATGLNVIINGFDGDDILTGGAGNDIINDGFLGTDVMRGGDGDDTYMLHDVSDMIFENANEGTDLVVAFASIVLSDNVENLLIAPGISDLDGTGNELDNDISGNSGANLLKGLDGNDTLTGNAGADTLVGGKGDDTYIIDGDDQLSELTGEGTDSVKSGVSYGLLVNFENLTLTGSDNIDATGNDEDNILIGNSGDNSLTGGKGADTLDGGLGADSLDGGEGNDTYIIDDSDTVIELVDGGIDTVKSATTIVMADFVENLILTGTDDTTGTGNAQDNTITGNSGNNTFYSNGGTDILIGGAGSDTYFIDSIDDVVTEDLDKGADVIFSTVTYTLSANVEQLSLGFIASNINGTGNGLANKLIGNNGNNILDGGDGTDTLLGLDGNDTFIGSKGFDIFTGGNGTDTADFSGFASGITATYTAAGTGTIINTLDSAKIATLNTVEQTIGTASADSYIIKADSATITSGSGADTFQFAFDDVNGALSAGAVLVDFENGVDHLVFDTTSAAYDSAQEILDVLLANAIQSGADIVITQGANSLTLKSMLLADLDVTDILVM